LKAAKSDVELWEAMEMEVFTLPDALGIGKDMKPKIGAQTSQRAGRNGVVRRTGRHQQEPKSPVQLAQQRDLEVRGPLYPTYLLLGLRLLDTNFVTSSSLALNVLPRLKQLGLASYVLGVSTSFYNTLMTIYWGRYGDANAILDLLEEMQHAGLYFDADTRSIVQAIMRELMPMAQGKRGKFSQEIARMPEFEDAVKKRLKHWEWQVRSSIGESDDRLVY